jgi:hypothetical protein
VNNKTMSLEALEWIRDEATRRFLDPETPAAERCEWELIASGATHLVPQFANRHVRERRRFWMGVKKRDGFLNRDMTA